MIKPAPKIVSTFGISPQMKYPRNIANTKFKYFVGVTSDASAILSDTVSKILATEPIIPVKIKRKSSNFDGMIQPKGSVARPTIMLNKEKNSFLSSFSNIILCPQYGAVESINL